MGIFYLLFGGVIGYLVAEKVSVKNWGMKLCHAFLIPLVINIVVTLLLVLITGNAYIAGGMAFPFIIASIAYVITILIKMKVRKLEGNIELFIEVETNEKKSPEEKDIEQYKKNIAKVEREMQQSVKKIFKALPGVLAVIFFIAIAGYSAYIQTRRKTIECLYFNSYFNRIVYHASSDCESITNVSDYNKITDNKEIYNTLSPYVSPNNTFCDKCLPKKMRDNFLENYED